MENRNIIVVGASAGGFETLKTLVSGLPIDFPASIFIVWHMSPNGHNVLPQVLNRLNTMHVAQAYDREPIKGSRIYVAPSDRHLIVERDYVRVTRGPKENRFRPAVDPLFRSAAYAYGPRVIGVVLTGALDDGTSGLWTIKHCGGVAVVQDPKDAEVASMPESALRKVEVDHVVPISQMAELLISLSKEEVVEIPDRNIAENKQTSIEIGIAAEDYAFASGIMSFGKLTPYTCPECHGVLTKLDDGDRFRFRCHTGHAFSADSLLATVTENIEASLYSAMRGVEESIMLLNHIGDHFAEINQPKVAAIYFNKAKEAEQRVQLVRQAVLSHEALNQNRLLWQTVEADNH